MKKGSTGNEKHGLRKKTKTEDILMMIANRKWMLLIWEEAIRDE